MSVGARVDRAFGDAARWVSDRRLDVGVAIALFVVVVAALLVSEKSLGFTRDEGYYFKAAELYFGWFRDLWAMLGRGDLFGAFDGKVIDKHWSYNHEHPVLMKTLFALSWGLGKEWLGIFELHSTAFRFPGMVMGGLSTALIYVFSRALRLGRPASLIAALLWVSMPRAYWHMHLACFDIAVCAAHLWLVLAYYKGRSTVRGAVMVGVAFGLAAAVKHNVLVTPAFFVLHWALCEAHGFSWKKSGWKIPPLPLSFFAMAILGPIIFVLHWPYLWPDILKRVGWYLGFHLNHEHYPILWFGDLLEKPPFPVSFPFVMSAVTIPLPTLLLFVTSTLLAGLVAARFVLGRFRKESGKELTLVPLGDPDKEPTGSVAVLLLLNVAFPFLLIALPSSPIFGGTKHWMNALPFLCILSGWTLSEGAERFKRYWAARSAKAEALFAASRAPAIVLVGAFCVLPAFWLSARVHPYGLSAYNSLAGFTRGAANIGFQRTFWGHEPRLALPLVNERTAPRGGIAFGDTNRDDHKMYRRDGLLRSDIRLAGQPDHAKVSSVQPQGEFKDQWLRTLEKWGVNGPDHVVHLEGVPLVTITFRD
jgi:hypothetical protein